jgi:cation:H+ antiporter
MSIFLAAIMLSIGGLYIGGLVWYEGLIMVVLLVCYLCYVIKSPNNDNVVTEDSNHSEKAESSMLGIVVLLTINLGALFVSGDFVISSLIESAKLLGLSDTKLATSVLAVGTSIPEIATAIVLVRQNNADSLFGEIIGSNIFDLLGILGVISLFGNLSIDSNLLVFLSVSIFLMFLVTSTIMNDKRINRLEGISLISLFVIFTIQLVNV